NNSTRCQVQYQNGGFWLLADDQTSLVGPVNPGQSRSNTYCTLRNPSLTTSGSSFTLSLPLTFTSAFTGAQAVRAYIADIYGMNSGWVDDGTWIVGTAQAPTVSATRFLVR